MFLSLVVEKVVLVKVLNVVKAAYDPLSTSQTTRLKDLIIKLRNTYPTLTGSSKQVKELLTSVIDKFKASIGKVLNKFFKQTHFKIWLFHSMSTRLLMPLQMLQKRT